MHWPGISKYYEESLQARMTGKNDGEQATICKSDLNMPFSPPETNRFDQEYQAKRDSLTGSY